MDDLSYQLIDTIDASIYWKDLNGVYLGCNKYMLKMAGFNNREEIINKTDYLLPWRKQAGKINDIDSLVIKTDKTYKIEECPLIDGNIHKVYLSSKAPLKDKNGNTLGIIGISIDITEKKKLESILKSTEEKLVETLSIKERFLKNIDHETRNPLQAIVCSAETLEDNWNKFNDKQRFEAIKLISNSSRRLEKLVTRTFDLSNFLKNKTTLNLKKLNLTEVIKETIISLNSNNFDQKLPRIILDNRTKDYTLAFDREKIIQVLNNLFENAIKWTSNDKIISVELHEAYFLNSTIKGIQCRIKDQGIGIPDNQLQFIFEPFTESSRTASPACGIGLGLPLCKEILKLHSGEIWAENNLQEGSTFNFIIPLNLG